MGPVERLRGEHQRASVEMETAVTMATAMATARNQRRGRGQHPSQCQHQRSTLLVPAIVAASVCEIKGSPSKPLVSRHVLCCCGSCTVAIVSLLLVYYFATAGQCECQASWGARNVGLRRDRDHCRCRCRCRCRCKRHCNCKYKEPQNSWTKNESRAV